MATSRTRRTATALVLASALGLLPAGAGAATLYRRGDVPTYVQRHSDPSFVEVLWGLLTSFWAKAGAKIDGNG
jgi:hypothetical protein